LLAKKRWPPIAAVLLTYYPNPLFAITFSS
jgi:hypothetical protein